NEPTYCYCNKISFGEVKLMCQNEECPREWFHLGCAGFSVAPQGKWYCEICR
ncbi:hypothetical protein BCR39DRAFT_451816, partial [Naematelia encephala]